MRAGYAGGCLMDEIKLKPCPFCGKKVGIYYWDSDEQNEKVWEECDEYNHDVFPFIMCCFCGMQTYLHPSGKELIEAWNRMVKDES